MRNAFSVQNITIFIIILLQTWTLFIGIIIGLKKFAEFGNFPRSWVSLQAAGPLERKRVSNADNWLETNPVYYQTFSGPTAATSGH